MDKNELYNEVKQAVDAIFNEKEEAEKQKKAEEALRKSATTIDELTKELESNKSEYSELETKYNEVSASVEEKDQTISSLEEEKSNLQKSIEEKDEEIANLKEELEGIKPKKEEVETELSNVKEELDNIKKDRLAETRIAELEEAKVANKDKESQMKKIRDMSDEEFSAYKEELISLRETIVASIEEDTEDKNKKKSFANVDGKNKNSAFNLESQSGSDFNDEYDELGKAMASLMSNEEE